MPPPWRRDAVRRPRLADELPDWHGADLAGADSRLKDLLFFFMAERGIYIARRGFIVLSLPLTDAHVDRFVAAFNEFAARIAAIPAAPATGSRA